MFQFTHPRGVRRRCQTPRRNRLRVSIHAPARGATGLNNLKATAYPVSIHAPARGATRLFACGTQTLVGFNSRTREGCDIGCDAAICALESFNSRTREGCDQARLRGDEKTAKFQFTHPRGVRLKSKIWRARRFGFNSRTREGCDYSGRRTRRNCVGFNSRTREGCDLADFQRRIVASDVSIHAPARGTTVKDGQPVLKTKSFNSRTREGCDITLCIYSPNL